MSSPDLSASAAGRQRAGGQHLGGALSLIGGVGLLGALFLPWLSLTLVSEQYCSVDECYSTPSNASLRGWEILFAHPFVFYLLLPLLVLSAAVNVTSGVMRLRTPQWNSVWFWCALLLSSAALTAFVPWLITVPLPGAPLLVDGYVIGYQYAVGLYVALAAGLASLVGTLLDLERLPKQPSPGAHGRRATRERRFSSGLALIALTLILVYVAFFVSAAIFLPPMSDEVLHGWEVYFFLVVPPAVGGLALASLLQAFRQRQRVWLGLLCLALTHLSLGWAYALSVSLGTLGRLGAGTNADAVLELLGKPIWSRSSSAWSMPRSPSFVGRSLRHRPKVAPAYPLPVQVPERVGPMRSCRRHSRHALTEMGESRNAEACVRHRSPQCTCPEFPRLPGFIRSSPFVLVRGRSGQDCGQDGGQVLGACQAWSTAWRWASTSGLGSPGLFSRVPHRPRLGGFLPLPVRRGSPHPFALVCT